MLDLVQSNFAVTMPEGIEFHIEDLLDGVHVLIRFPNGYGASIIRHSGSYGGKKGLWEAGVIQFYGANNGTNSFWDFVGDALQLPEFEGEFQGWLDAKQVDNYLSLIALL
jgi:hypothetical protein